MGSAVIQKFPHSPTATTEGTTAKRSAPRIEYFLKAFDANADRCADPAGRLAAEKKVREAFSENYKSTGATDAAWSRVNDDLAGVGITKIIHEGERYYFQPEIA
jgi:hypothetical protein